MSKQKDEIKAHKLVLLTASSFFKRIFTSELDSYRIVLPNYSTQAISVFVQFFYNSGEILINESLIQEFACLCHEFSCQEIPVISDLIKNHKEPEDVPLLRGDLERVESTNPSAVRNTGKVEIEFDEYFETHEHVETIFFNENEGEFLDRTAETSNAKLEENQEAVEVKEEYLNVQYLDETPSFMAVDPDKPFAEEAERKRDDATCKLENSVNQEKKELNIFDIEKKQSIGRNVLFKQVQKINEPPKQTHKPSKSSAAPSITFPAVAMNLTQLREEQNRFKKRLQEAINSCRDSGNSVKKAAKMFGVPQLSIERNLRGFKNTNL